MISLGVRLGDVACRGVRAAVAVATPLTYSWRVPVSAAQDSLANSADITALAASSANKTLPEINVPGSSTRAIALSLGTIVAPGGLLYLNTKYSNEWSISVASSLDSTNGTNGTWTDLSFAPRCPTGALGSGTMGKFNDRGQWLNLASGGARWLRITMTTLDGTALSVFPGVFQLRQDGNHPLIGVTGCSIEQYSMLPIEARDYIRSLYPASDPIIVNWGLFGYKYGQVLSSGIQPLLATGLPCSAYLFGGNPNDYNSSGRPFATDTAARKTQMRSDIDQCLTTLVGTGKPIFAGSTAFFDYNGYIANADTNGTNNPEMGAQPYNGAITQPSIKTNVPTSIASSIDAPIYDEYSATLDNYEANLGADNIHFSSAGSSAYQRQWAPAWSVLAGSSVGGSWFESRVADAANGTPAWQKNRLVQLHAQLAPTAIGSALTARASLATTISNLPTTYADPNGVTLPSAIPGGAPIAWFDASKWDTVTSQMAQVRYQSGVATLAANLTSGSTTVSAFKQATDVPIGAGISGNGIPTGATIVGRDQAAQTLTMSAPATATGTSVAVTISGAGNKVAALADRSGTNLLQQATVAGQPLYMANAQNRFGVLRPGGSTSLSTTSGTILTSMAGMSQPFTLAFNLRVNPFGTGGDLMGWNSSGGILAFIGHASTTGSYSQSLSGLRFYADAQTRMQESVPLTPWVTYWFVLTYDGATATLYRNGTQTASTMWVKAAWSPSVFRLGCRGTGSNFTSHEHGEVILYDRALSGSSLAALQTYGRTKWGTA